MAKLRIPHPPHPKQRTEKLPWQTPKSTEEDAEALKRIETLMHDPGYLQADKDVAFLNRYESRGVRLELDYAKAELQLTEHGLKHAIVVFGSARTPEPTAARQKVERLQKALADSPGDAGLERLLAVAMRVMDNSRYYQVARDFGRLVGETDKGRRVDIVTGGGPGIMEAANRGAYDAGAQTAGLNINLPHEQYPNPYITPGLCLSFHYFAVRKLHFLLRARALVAFPGGYGTMDELFETLTLVQTRTIAPLPIVLVGESFWRKVVNFEALAEEGVIDAEDLNLFWFAETPEDILETIVAWHDANGTSLFA